MAGLKEILKAEALNLGFSFLGVAAPIQTPHFANYLDWMGKGFQANLDYLSKEYVINGRRNPASLLKGAKSVIVTGIHFEPAIDSCDTGIDPANITGNIAAYAALPDYHQLINEKAGQLIDKVGNYVGRKVRERIFVDSGPVMEKDFAYQAGLGWIGRNSLLITPDFGSCCLLGCVFTDLELEPDSPLEGDICEGCAECINACPTQCIHADRTVDIKNCLSYLTTTKRSYMNNNEFKSNSGWIFGCDICQIVCPYNSQLVKIKKGDQIPPIKPIISQRINIPDDLALNHASFQQKYDQTPILQIGLKRYRENLENA